MKRSRIVRAGGALAYGLRRTVRSPGEAKRILNEVGAGALDLVFEDSSPIPYLDPHLARVLQSQPVSLPPLGLMAPGNQNLTGLVYLVSLAGLVDARCILEIGTYNGFTALTLARNRPAGTIHTVDLPSASPARLALSDTDRGHIAYLRRHPERVYEGTEEQQRIVQHFADSALFDFSGFEARCDLVYVDGAHSHEYVKSDTERALEIVAPGGVIVWDDYQRHEPDVARYLNASGIPGLQRLPGSRLVVWMSAGARKRLELLDSTSELATDVT